MAAKKPRVSGTVQKLRKELGELKTKLYRMEVKLEEVNKERDALHIKHQLALTGGLALREHAEKIVVWYMAEARKAEKKNANNPQETSN